MPNIRRGVLRPVLIIILIAAGALLASRLDYDPRQEPVADATARPSAPPELRLQYGRNQLDVFATTVSPAHENALRELLADQFASSDIEADFREALEPPAEWEMISTRLLYVAAATSSANVVADGESISIRATTEDPEDYQSRIEFLQEMLTSGHQIASEVISADPDVALQELCVRNFAAITARTNATQQALRFRHSTTNLGESAHALLDRLAEFAYDCEETRIAVLGYTDSTGAESWNLQVSEARAQAVAAQLVQRGVAADRLLVEGRGSQSPLADNDTVQGRAQNRRIEFELR